MEMFEISHVQCTCSRPKHTHRHRAPPLVGLSVYLDFKGMGPTVLNPPPPNYTALLLF